VIDRLETFCRRHDLPWDSRRADRFEEYLDLLDEFDDSMNLVGPSDPSTIVDELFVDSLVPAVAHPPEGPILDVGSGAGLPGIPLEIAFPDRSAALIEPRRKRSTFLRIAVNRLQLEGVEVERTRIEQFDGPSFDYVVSKALCGPAEWLETAAPFRDEGGVVVCMTTTDERGAADAAAAAVGLECVGAVEHADLPGDRSPNPPRAVFVYG